MSLPDVSIVVQDGQLGLVPASVANASVKVGVCSDGIVGQIYSANDNGTAQAALGQGPLVDAGAQTLSVAGGPVFFVPINPSAAGAASAVTTPIHLGTGAVAVGFAPRQSVQVKITLGGANGTGTFAIALGGGSYGASVATVGGTFNYAVPGTLTTITLAAAQTWVLNDVYTIATDGTVTLSGSGPAATNVTHADSPMDAYSVQLAITTGGALGTAQFTYSVDGGDNISGQILVPSGGKYAIPQTGIVLTFSSTFTLGDTYVFTTTSAGFSNSDITAALTTLNASATDYGFVHIVGAGANAAAAAATAAVIDSAMTAAFVAFRYVFAVMECPTSESDSTIATAFANVAATRVGVCAGDVALVSPINGRVFRRNLAWAYTARLADILAAQSPAAVEDGPLKNIGSLLVAGAPVSLYRDEAKTPLLDAARFVTARTFPGAVGYFITRGMMMAPSGSDFSRVTRRRVMDIACRVVRAAELRWLNKTVRVDKKTGFILEKDAQRFEHEVNGALNAVLLDASPPLASDCTVVMSRTTNILSTNSEPVSISIVPLGELENIITTIGFKNPALAV